MKLQRREVIILLVGFVLAFGLLYYTYYYQPFLDDVIALDAEIAQKSTELSTLQNHEAQLPGLLNEIEVLSAEIEASSTGIMLTKDNIELLVYIEDILEEVSENKTVLFTTDPINLEYCSLQPVSLSFRTDYDKLKGVLNELETSDNRNIISNISISYEEISGENIDSGLTDTTATLPGVEVTEEEEEIDLTLLEMIEVPIVPYNVTVTMNLQFFYYNDPIDVNKEYSFAKGNYSNNYIIPRPYEIFVSIPNPEYIDEEVTE